MSFYDDTKNSSGSLIQSLGSDVEQVKGLVTTIYMILFANFSALITGVIIAFYASWRMALVGLGMMPFLIISGKLHAQYVAGYSAKTDEAF